MVNSSERRVAIYTHDRMLYQKIRLELYGICDTEQPDAARRGEYDTVFVDLDCPEFAEIAGIGMSRTQECALPLPFRLGEARAILTREGRAPITVDDENKSVRLYGKSVRLTDVEFSLFLLLYNAGGEYVSRDEILRTVWGGDADGGVINVYIHYLREKLERSGERIILSSRNLGYKIDEKFFSEVEI